jgi:ABC-type multidrug transport system permease subunit
MVRSVVQSLCVFNRVDLIVHLTLVEVSVTCLLVASCVGTGLQFCSVSQVVVEVICHVTSTQLIGMCHLTMIFFVRYSIASFSLECARSVRIG